MKLASICILLSTLSICNYSNAQTTLPKDGIKINPELVERGKGFLKGFAKNNGKKVAIEGAKKTAPFVIPIATAKLVLQPKKTISTAVVLAAGAGAGFWWYSTTVPYAVKKLAKDPTDFEVYWDNLADDFDKKLDFAQTTWDLYYENTGEEQKKYENLLVLLGYERPSLVKDLTVVINPKTKVEQDDLERTNEFTLAMAEVVALATPIDAQYEPLCRSQVGQQIREQLIKLTPKDFAKLPLIKSNTNTIHFLNVDSYRELETSAKYLENDHIPSYLALEKFFVRYQTQKGGNVNKYNLKQNATAISIPYDMHVHNRTRGTPNIKLARLDQYDLKISTFLDFSTLLAMKKLDKGKWGTDKINYNDLLNAFAYLYGRNAQLCLYY